jgi:hypothetical protein
MAKGLDVGTSYIVLAQDAAENCTTSQTQVGTVAYTEFRDAFYVIKPTTPVATKMIEKGLEGKVFVRDSDGSFILLGQDAIEKAVERNDSAKRPMHRGVVSVKEKSARRVLAFILQQVCGQASAPNEKLVFCVPAQPVDQEGEDFDVGYHEDVVTGILADAGYAARAINEAEALCYSELEKDGYTRRGAVLRRRHGELLRHAQRRADGDVQHHQVRRLDRPDDRRGDRRAGQRRAARKGTGPVHDRRTEREPCAGGRVELLRAPHRLHHEAACGSHDRAQVAARFKDPLPVVIAGGTSKAAGFVERFSEKLAENGFPLRVAEVRHAADPLHAVARGCLIAAKIL